MRPARFGLFRRDLPALADAAGQLYDDVELAGESDAGRCASERIVGMLAAFLPRPCYRDA